MGIKASPSGHTRSQSEDLHIKWSQKSIEMRHIKAAALNLKRSNADTCCRGSPSCWLTARHSHSRRQSLIITLGGE